MEISTDRIASTASSARRVTGRAPRTREENDRIIDASLCFGAYEHGRQIAYALIGAAS
jgi:hypothetical protein